MMSSAGYMLNDWTDFKYDSAHPIKKSRPFASGQITIRQMAGIALATFTSALFLAYQVNYSFVAAVLIYFFITASYSLLLKNIPVLEIAVLISGFIIRIYAGAFIADVVISDWLMAMAILLVLLLATGKRRNELVLWHQKGIKARNAITYYNLTLLNVAVLGIGAAIIVTYTLYTINANIIAQFKTNNLIFTTLPVFAGMIRYAYLLFRTEKASNPAHLLINDPILLLLFATWIGTFAAFVYG